MTKFEELRVLKRLRKKLIGKIYNALEDEAKIANKPLGYNNEPPDYNNNHSSYNINVLSFNLILNNGYGYLESENKPTVDNCYVHILVSQRGTIFKTITDKKIYF